MYKNIDFVLLNYVFYCSITYIMHHDYNLQAKYSYLNGCSLIDIISEN